MATSATKTRVAICALTYRRPQGLARLLNALAELEVRPEVALRVVIVDNDADASGATTVDDARERLAVPLTYVVEPARSISIARNRAVRESVDSDFIAFIDDDEWPESDWLKELLESQALTGADIVAGGVLPSFEIEPDAWVRKGGFFDRRRHPHNESIRYATTSNVLIRRVCLDLVDGPFDEAFGLSGGEDTHLFAQLREAGCSIVWCDRAPVQELIAKSRVSTRWLLRREYRRGQTLSLSLRARGMTPWLVLRRVGNGLSNIGLGALGALFGVRRGRVGVLIGIRRVNFGVGMLTGLAGVRHLEYRKVHGA